MADLLPTTARGLKVVVNINYGVLLNARFNTRQKPRSPHAAITVALYDGFPQ
jgi:hypothetical protein